MSTLITESRFADPDRAYRALIEAHRGLPDEDSAALNTRLVLILANHVGDHSVLQEAIALARQSMETAGTKS
jgi:anthranilate phosphoribosyltransferase